MFGIDRRLRFLVTVALVMGVYWGCSQTTDIPTPISHSELTLIPERLPTPPPGMSYELWVVKTASVDVNLSPADVVSLGRFSYAANDTFRGFVDLSGNPIGNVFELSDDLFKFKNVVVSVERTAESSPVPSNIMLLDRIAGLPDIPIRLNFPLSEDLWNAIVRYNMEAVSDGDREANDAHGVWFSTYRATLDTLPDTVAWDTSSTFDTIVPDLQPIGVDSNGDTIYDTLNDTLIHQPFIDSLKNIRVDTMKLTFPRDTLVLDVDSFMHVFVAFDRVFAVDSTFPFIHRVFDINYTVPNPFQTVALDIFNQDQFGLPDYTDYGFHYKGWVVSPYVTTSASLTPPAYDFKSPSKNWIPGDTGGLLTTGTFSRIDAPDDGNPFTLKLIEGIDSSGDTTYKWPNYPGEDFLDSVALAGAGVTTYPVDLMPDKSGNSNEGTVFITLEPLNDTDTTTNFPLIAFIGSIPANYNAIHKPGVDPRFNSVQINMLNGTGTVPGDLIGFPEIVITFTRQ